MLGVYLIKDWFTVIQPSYFNYNFYELDILVVMMSEMRCLMFVFLKLRNSLVAFSFIGMSCLLPSLLSPDHSFLWVEIHWV